jgi:hypothetical protein
MSARGTLGFCVGLMLGSALFVGAHTAAQYQDQFGEYSYLAKDWGLVKCMVQVVPIDAEWGRKRTVCDKPEENTHNTRVYFMTYLSWSAKYAEHGTSLTCIWREYRSFRVWPPRINTYHSYEECDVLGTPS